jgi:superfamily II DNA or RNA helicase
VSNIKSKYKFGCTGTVTRKDSRHILTRKIIGPVAASTSIEALIPTVYLHPTKVPTKQFNYGMASSGYANQYLANDRQRNKLIVSMVLDDLDRGHSIVIPVLYKAHVKELQRLINDAYGSNICGVFVGGNKKDRESTIAKARSRNIKVVVGIRSMLQLNINVPAWSCIYEVMPINNRENLKQETARVCTPKEGKRPPIIRMFLDYGVGISIGCAKASLNHMTEFGYKLAGTDRQVEIQNSLSSGAKRNTVKTKYANNSTGRMGLWKKS